MHKTAIALDSNCRYMSIDNAVTYTGLGTNTLRKLAEDAQAIRRVGRRVLVDKIVLDKYLESQASQEN